MFMHAKSAGFLIFSLTKDARCKPATNSYARHVILTPWLLNSFSLPFFPKKSILGNLVLTIFFLLSMRTPETRLLEAIFFEVTKVYLWPFWFHGQGWKNVITMDYKGPSPYQIYCYKQFQLNVHSNTKLHWFCLTSLFDWSRKLPPLCCISSLWLNLLMAPCVISLCSDWPLRLLRFRFHNAQPKCAPVAFNQTICFVHFHCGSGIKKFQNGSTE